MWNGGVDKQLGLLVLFGPGDLVSLMLDVLNEVG